MNKIITLLIAFIIIVSCKEEAKPSKQTKESSTETITNKNSSVATEKNLELTSDNEQLLSMSIAYFKNCKENSSSRNECRNSSTKMISEFYKIDDFKNNIYVTSSLLK